MLGLGVTVVLAAGCSAAVVTPVPPQPSPTRSAPAAASDPSAAASAAVTVPAMSVAATASAVSTDLDTELASSGTLVSCTDIRGTAMSSYDADGKPIGVNIEIAEEIAMRLRVVPQIQDTEFETIIEAIEDGACDLGISSMHITAARLDRIEMVPISQGAQHVIVRVGNPAGIQTLTDLCGKVLAVQSGSTHVDLVLGLGDHAGEGLDAECQALGLAGVDLREFEVDADAVEALATGVADAYIGSDFVTVDRPTEFELSVTLPPTRNGIGLAKGRPLLHEGVATAVQSMIDDGTYLAILRKYGAEDISIAD